MASSVAQRWHLVGLQAMHEAMVRRIANEECDAARRDSKFDIGILWSRAESLSHWTQWSHPNHADVIIAQSDRLIDAMEAAEALNSTTLLATGPDQCLRLIWGGLDGDLEDLYWSTEWLASGIIADASSLRSWIRSAVRHARTIPQPPHPFLRKQTPFRT